MSRHMNKAVFSNEKQQVVCPLFFVSDLSCIILRPISALHRASLFDSDMLRHICWWRVCGYTPLYVVHCCVGVGMDNGSEGDLTTSVVKLLTLPSNSRES